MITVAEAVRRPYDNFTILRLALAVAVVVSHAGSISTGRTTDEPLWALTGYTLGEHGVNGFFAISGFLVAMSWDRRGGALPFAVARLLRVFPGLIAAVLFTALVVGGTMTTRPLAAYLGDSAMWKMIWQTVSTFKSATTLPGVFEANPVRWPIATVWTLRYELFCYAGLLAYGVFGGFRKPSVALLFAAVLVGLLIGHGWKGPIPKGQETALRLPLIFACGALAWLYRDRISVSLLAAAGAIFAVLLAGAVSAALYRPMLFIASAYVALVIALAPGLSHPRFEPPGDISYGVYLYGWPVQQALQALAPSISAWTMLPVALAMTVALATLSWLFIEKPALKLKARFMAAR